MKLTTFLLLICLQPMPKTGIPGRKARISGLWKKRDKGSWAPDDIIPSDPVRWHGRQSISLFQFDALQTSLKWEMEDGWAWEYYISRGNPEMAEDGAMKNEHYHFFPLC